MDCSYLKGTLLLSAYRQLQLRWCFQRNRPANILLHQMTKLLILGHPTLQNPACLVWHLNLQLIQGKHIPLYVVCLPVVEISGLDTVPPTPLVINQKGRYYDTP